jgi:hypothetical protein
MTNGDKIGPSHAHAKYAQLSEKTKVLCLIERIKELFGIETTDGVVSMRIGPVAEAVEELAAMIINMWPRDLPVRATQTTEPADGLNVLFWGDRTPNAIAAHVTRASLYAERILIMNPFVDIFLHNPEQSPLVKPCSWTGVYGIAAVFCVLLEPWVRADLVEIITNPVCFDFELFKALDSATSESLKRIGPQYEKIMRDSRLDIITEVVCQTSPSQRDALLEFIMGDLSQDEREIVRIGVAAMLRLDPQLANVPIPPHDKSQIIRTGSGMSYEQARLIASLHCATILADQAGQGRLLKCFSREFSSPLQKSAHALEQLEFSFLNNVPVEFAIEIRRSGKLGRFRRYLFDLSKSFELRAPSGAFSESSAIEMVNRLRDEYEDYRQEWKGIQRTLGAKALVGAPALGAIAAAPLIASGSLTGIGLLGSLGLVLTAQTKALLEGILGRRELDRQPLSLLLRLDRPLF